MLVVNLWAVLLAGIMNMVLGALWYSPLLFGKKWMRIIGWTEKDMEGKKEGMEKAYALSFLGGLLMAFVMAHFVKYTGAKNVLEGAQTGLWIWVGFVITTSLGGILFEGRKKGLYYINNAYHLVSLTLMGIIFAVWQ